MTKSDFRAWMSMEMIFSYIYIYITKAAFNKKKNLFTSKLDLNLRKKLVKCYVWSMAVYGAETWMLRATSETPGKFWNVVLEKDGDDQLDRSCEKWSVTESQWAEEYPTWNKKTEG